MTNPKAIEMMEYLAEIKKKPEKEQEKLAKESLMRAGIINKKGELKRPYACSVKTRRMLKYDCK